MNENNVFMYERFYEMMYICKNEIQREKAKMEYWEELDKNHFEYARERFTLWQYFYKLMFNDVFRHHQYIELMRENYESENAD